MTHVFRDRAARTGFWAVAGCYVLIAFEFFYMASPFAAYVYAAYRPGLGRVMDLPGLAWLTEFFLPHYVTATSSWVVRLHEPVGIVVMALGLLGFTWGAGQVYWAKLTRRGAVTGGLYRWVRHPQYTALSLSGFGLLLLWPRYGALALWVTMLFAYGWLARVEERECERRYGPSYLDYQARTGGFLPGTTAWLPPLGAGMGLLLYVACLGAALGLGRYLQHQSIRSLSALYQRDSAYVAVSDLERDPLGRVALVAGADPRVESALRAARERGGRAFINYVLPADAFVPEIPMSAPAGVHCHQAPRGVKSAHYRVVFTQVERSRSAEPRGPAILLDAITRIPVLEAWIDLDQARVERVAAPSVLGRFAGTPVPIL